MLLLDELNELEEELHWAYNEALDSELPTTIREEKQRAAGKMLHSLASLFIPGYSPESYRDIIVSGMTLIGKDALAHSVDDKITKGFNACEAALESTPLLECQVLLDFVDKMKNRYKERMDRQ